MPESITIALCDTSLSRSSTFHINTTQFQYDDRPWCSWQT
jgi:hypothetical protein